MIILGHLRTPTCMLPRRWHTWKMSGSKATDEPLVHYDYLLARTAVRPSLACPMNGDNAYIDEKVIPYMHVHILEQK